MKILQNDPVIVSGTWSIGLPDHNYKWEWECMWSCTTPDQIITDENIKYE